MEEKYIKDYVDNLFEEKFDNDLERLKGVYYGLSNVLDNIIYNMDNEDDKKAYSVLNDCMFKIKSIIDDEENKESIPLF